MNDPVETLARALRQIRDDALAGRRLRDDGIDPVARALIAQITPALVAEAVKAERAAMIARMSKVSENCDKERGRMAEHAAATVKQVMAGLIGELRARGTP